MAEENNAAYYSRVVGIAGLREQEAEVEKITVTQRLPVYGAGGVIPADVVGQDAANAVLAQRRMARANYGCAANARFLGTFLVEDPMLSRFVVATCNYGVFQGEVRHPLAGTAACILSYLRYDRSDNLAKNRLEQFAQYQSYAMAELIGPFIPDNRRLNQFHARAEIQATVQYGLMDDDFQELIGDWFDPLVGPWEAVNAIVADEVTFEEAMAILLAWAAAVEDTKVWPNNANVFVNTVVSLSKRGNVTEESAEKIQEGVRDELGRRNIQVVPLVCRKFYTLFGRWITGANAAELFEFYRNIMPNVSQRLNLTILQAAGSGLTVYFIISKAITTYHDFDWARVIQLIGPEINLYEAAVNLVGQNAYYGFNNDLNQARSTNFISLGYVCQQLCIKVGGEAALRRYAGLRQGVKVKAALDDLVTGYVEQRGNVNINAADIAQANDRMAALRQLLVPAQE